MRHRSLVIRSSTTRATSTMRSRSAAQPSTRASTWAWIATNLPRVRTTVARPTSVGAKHPERLTAQSLKRDARGTPVVAELGVDFTAAEAQRRALQVLHAA